MRKDWVRVSSKLEQDRRAWDASIRDAVNSISDAGLTTVTEILDGSERPPGRS